LRRLSAAEVASVDKHACARSRDSTPRGRSDPTLLIAIATPPECKIGSKLDYNSPASLADWGNQKKGDKKGDEVLKVQKVGPKVKVTALWEPLHATGDRQKEVRRSGRKNETKVVS
jgi:hypothetical protein